MLRWDTQIAHVAECVLTFARCKQIVELRGVWILWRPLLLCLLWLDGRLLDGCREVLNRVWTGVELICCLLLLQSREGGFAKIRLLCGLLCPAGEWIVRSSWLRTDWRLSRVVRCPGIVRAGLSSWLFLDRLLLLLLTETVAHLLSPRVIGVLWLDELLLGLLHLLETSLLRLLVTKPTTISVLESSLLWLNTCGLVIRIVVVSSWLSLDWIAKPIHLSLLLVSLVEAGRLRLLSWSIVEKQVLLLLIFELSLSQLFLFSAQLDGLGEIIIGVLRAM